MKLLSQGRVAAAGGLAGFLLLAAGRVVADSQVSVGLTAAGAVCLLAVLVLLRDLRGRFQEMLTDLQTKQTTKA
jgi:hypothetical protein